MKHVLYAALLALALSLAGCGKYEVYERNLMYMTQDTLNTERGYVNRRLEEAQAQLAQAQSSGDPERIRKAQSDYNDAAQQSRIMDSELRRRARGW